VGGERGRCDEAGRGGGGRREEGWLPARKKGQIRGSKEAWSAVDAVDAPPDVHERVVVEPHAVMAHQRGQAVARLIHQLERLHVALVAAHVQVLQQGEGAEDDRGLLVDRDGAAQRERH